MTPLDESPRIEWEPTLVALAIAMVLLWLAGGPLTLPESFSGPDPIPAFALLAPSGELPAFPREFRWLPVPGADVYEVTVIPANGGAPLFRQRGPTTIVEVEVEPGLEPPPGSYVWEVVALRSGEEIARGARSFDVAP
jgi:hypothetical protein